MTARGIEVFDRVADRYDEVIPFFAAFAGELADSLGFTAGARVLDLAAGRGAVAAEALARGCRVTAVDAAANMVARLRADHPAVAGHVMDAHRLGFPDGSFDVVVSGFAMHLFADPAVVFDEVRRILVPGGVFAFTVPGGPDPATDPLPELFAEFGRYLPPGGGMGRPLDARAAFTGAGFAGVEAVTLTVDLPVAGAEVLWEWGLTHGSLAYFEDLPADRREEFRARLFAEVTGPTRLRRQAQLWTGSTG
ncbi:class I SAM-dependent methyltransferase [Saccharopolyspora taberi]|uniref:class I SAM-dependent methyltransferase n=1 Tax=Saccharopolyspora taberi TaxID=60895 RepID=UPI0031E39C85